MHIWYISIHNTVWKYTIYALSPRLVLVLNHVKNALDTYNILVCVLQVMVRVFCCVLFCLAAVLGANLQPYGPSLEGEESLEHYLGNYDNKTTSNIYNKNRIEDWAAYCFLFCPPI